MIFFLAEWRKGFLSSSEPVCKASTLTLCICPTHWYL